jgi:hypothetical protein
MGKEDTVSVQWAQGDVETSYSVLNSNNNNNNNNNKCHGVGLSGLTYNNNNNNNNNNNKLQLGCHPVAVVFYMYTKHEIGYY